MPGKIKVKILAGRNLPVMDRSGDTTDAYVELKFGNVTFKTDVCRKSLNPQWNSEWYRFEVDDAELQDEPLQIRLMDHDTYSANDAIGKVYINLNPLLLPGVPPTVKNIWTLEAAMNTSTGSQGSVMTGWIPVYDTMHGIRGEVNITVKVELFSDFNKFRQSSCGVQFFYSPNIPYGYQTQSIHGFVEELIVTDDPEYKWIDKIRTPRASNEARQTLFFKLSGEVQRKIGLKALDLGGNAVIGYLQNFDLEGESGIVARGIGTAVTLVKVQDIGNLPPDNFNLEEATLACFDESVSLLPATPTYIPDPVSDARKPRKHSPRTPRRALDRGHRGQRREWSEERRRPQQPVYKPSTPVPRLKKCANSSPALSESIIDDASIRMLLALEDYRGETSRSKLDLRLKNLRKFFGPSDSDSKAGSSQRLNSLMCKSASTRSSMLSIAQVAWDRSKESKSPSEGIAAMLIKSIHSEPLIEWKEDITPDREKTVKIEDIFEPRGKKETFESSGEAAAAMQVNCNNERESSFEENTPSSDNEFSNDSAAYDILNDSMCSIDEDVDTSSRYSKTLARASTFPPMKSRLRCTILQRTDSDALPLNEESTFSIAKCLSASQILINPKYFRGKDTSASSTNEVALVARSIERSLKEYSMYDSHKDYLQKERTTKEPNRQVLSKKSNAHQSDKSNSIKLTHSDQENDTSSDFSSPAATSTPIENLSPFFATRQNYNKVPNAQSHREAIVPSSANSLPGRSPPRIFRHPSKLARTLSQPASGGMSHSRRREPKFVQKDVKLSRKVLLQRHLAGSAKVARLKENSEVSTIDESEISESRYSRIPGRSSDMEATASKPTIHRSQSTRHHRVGPPLAPRVHVLRRKESQRNTRHGTKLKGYDRIAKSFVESTNSLPTLSCPMSNNQLLTVSQAEKHLNGNSNRKITVKLESSAESLPQSSSSDAARAGYVHRRDCMLELIKIIDTKMMVRPEQRDAAVPGRLRKRKREKSHRTPGAVCTSYRTSVHQQARAHLSRNGMDKLSRVSSIPSNLSFAGLSLLPSRNESSSCRSSLESITSREIVRSRLPTAGCLSRSRQSHNQLPLERSPARSHTSAAETIAMTELKPRDTNFLSSPRGLACQRNDNAVNVSAATTTPRGSTNNTNTANMTYNSCVSRPSPDRRLQDESSLSPSYPMPTVPTVLPKAHSPATKCHPPLHRRSSDSDLSVTPKGNSLGGSDRSMGGLLKTSNTVIRTMNQDTLEMLEYPFITMQQYPPGFIIHIGGLVSSRSVKLLERISNLEEPESRDAWWTEIRMEVRSHARALACNVVIGYREETSICDDVCVLNASGTAAVINLHNPSQELDGIFLNRPQQPGAPIDSDREKLQQKTSATVATKIEKIEGESAIPNHGQSTGKVRHTSESRDADDYVPSSFRSKCSLCHLPYNESSVPFKVNVSKCAICKRAKVPDIMFTTIELPEGIPTIGRGCFIQATVCKNKKDLRAELNAKEISDCLPFLEYELHSLLLNKLKVKGMNAIFGLKLQVSVGERLIIGMAVGTAVYLTSLPPPPVPQIASGNSWPNEDQLADIQKTLVDTVKKNRDFYGLKPIVDMENGRVPATSDTDESDEDLPDLNFSMGTRDACVLEVDDIQDMDRVSLLMDDKPPDDFHIVNTQTIPGLEDLEIVRNLQMFTQISRAKIPASQLTSMPSKYIAKMLQSVYFKLRRMVPCALCDMQFKLALPEQDEVQFTVVGMALGLGDPIKINNKPKKKIICHSTSKDQMRKTDDSDMIFSLDVDHTEILTDNANNNALGNSSIPTVSLKHRPRSPLRAKMYATHRHKHVPLKGRYGVDITPLSYLPSGRIERYLGNLNFFFIRESTSIRENGGLSGFTHSFVMEVLAIVRAHITALGGNAMVAFFMTQCVLLHSPHKNHGQCLINVGGDVVSVSYFTDEKPIPTSNC